MSYLKEIFNQYKGNNKGLLTKLRYDNQLRKELIEATSFLPIESLISERVLYYQQKWTEPQLCPYCNKQKRKFKKLDKGLFPTCGDEKCKKMGMSKGAKQPRDWNQIQDKMKATYKAKTGYEHNMQNPEFIKEYKENFAKTHNGVCCGVRTELANINREKTIKEKYGSTYEMFKQGAILKYGSLSNMNKIIAVQRGQTNSNNKFKNLIAKLKELDFTYVSHDNDQFIVKCNKCGREFHITRYAINVYYRNNNRFCPKCDYKNMTFRSKFEKEVRSYIDSIYNGIIKYNRYINKKEYDIIIPDLKIAIECNGVYWHNELYKNKNYHFDKKLNIEKDGWHLIQIWDDDWNDKNKNEIIKSRLKSKLNLNNKIYARNCVLKTVSGSESKKFLEENHLQGYVSASYNYGLYYNNKLVQLMTIGHARKILGNKNKELLELIRLCTIKNYNIIGGFSKLLKYVKNIFKDKLLISYSDCDWCKLKDSGYDKVGFKNLGSKFIDYYWCVDGFRRNRSNYMKSKLIKQGFNPDMSESEIMHDRGYYKVYGSGNIKYELQM